VSVGRIRRALASERWQEPIPGVVVSHSGPLTQRQRWLVGLAHAGSRGCLSHRSALSVLGCRVEELPAARRVAGVRGSFTDPPEGGLVEVSVPHGRHLRSSGFVVVHQSRRPLEPVVRDGLAISTAARAAVDVAITASRRSDVDHVISHVLQRGLTTVEQLVEETRALGRRATAWLRAAVADAARGMRSVGERVNSDASSAPRAYPSRSGTHRSRRPTAPTSSTPCGGNSGSEQRRMVPSSTCPPATGPMTWSVRTSSTSPASC